MSKKERFTFRIDSEEKHLIAILSQRLQRNQSDTVRWILREAFKSLEQDNGGKGQYNASPE